MSTFWQRVIGSRPELVDTVVYFSPTKHSDLACTICGDGTVSPVCSPTLRYESIRKLADAWKQGEIVSDSGSKLPFRVVRSRLDFSKDFFFHRGRQNLVKNIFHNDAMERSASRNEDSSTAGVSLEGENAPRIMDGEATVVSMAQFMAPNSDNEQLIEANDSIECQAAGSGTPSSANAPETTKKRCPGFDRRRHDQAIKIRLWDGARMEFSPVIMDDDRCWSKTCKGEIRSYQRLCWDCKGAQQRLWEARRYLRKNVHEGNRIRCTNDRWLTTEEKIKKKAHILSDALYFLRRKTKEKKSLEKELRKHRPDHLKDQLAVQSITRKLNEETAKVQSPQCQWLVNEDEVCGYTATSINHLVHHIRHSHILPQWEANKERSPTDRQYRCGWYGCRRSVAFGKLQNLRRHMATHSGNARTDAQLCLLREQMVNASRPPTGRRYDEKTAQAVLRQYKSRRSWERTRDMSQLPLPTGRSVLAWKNDGGIKSGIDWTVVSTMAKVGEIAGHLRHGILTFDEIYVNPKRQLAPNGNQEFGWANNVDGELARTILVFQYVALSRRKRFAVNVAWYGCGINTGLNTETLESWLWDVMLALQGHGFRVHGLVCDGHQVNRSLQKKLVKDAIDAGFDDCRDYAINHPLTAEPGVRLFLFSDPSHAIKKWRNCWFNRSMAFSPTAPDVLYRNCPMSPDVIRWTDLALVAEWQSHYPRVDRRLTNKHLEMTNYSKMNVRTAVDVCSEAIESVLVELDAFGTSSTRYYMRIGRQLWLSLNSNRTLFSEGEADEMVAGLQWVAQQLTIWRDNTCRAPERFLTIETYEDIMLLVKGVPPFISYVWDVIAKEVPGTGFWPKAISQDGLESTFGALRQHGGGSQNITALSVAYNLRKFNCNVLNDFLQALNV